MAVERGGTARPQLRTRATTQQLCARGDEQLPGRVVGALSAIRARNPTLLWWGDAHRQEMGLYRPETGEVMQAEHGASFTK